MPSHTKKDKNGKSRTYDVTVFDMEGVGSTFPGSKVHKVDHGVLRFTNADDQIMCFSGFPFSCVETREDPLPE